MHIHRALVALVFVVKLLTNPNTPVRIEITPNTLNIPLWHAMHKILIWPFSVTLISIPPTIIRIT